MFKIKKLRHWKQADRGWFRELDCQCFPAPDQSFYNDSSCHWWVVYDGKTPVGFAGVYWNKSGPAHLTRAGVLPACRGHGLQRKLIAVRLRWCRRQAVPRVKTYSWKHNHPSNHNLQVMGFTPRAGLGSRSEYINWSKTLTGRKRTRST